MADYKDTLNLPTTDFPMKASLNQREPERLKQWQTSAIYDAINKSTEGKPLFVLHDSPPYANGHLHCGHALNKILKDIIIKSKTLSGYHAPYVPGWDCHGLPIELNVEKKIGKAGVKVPPREFRDACRRYADSQIDIQRDEFMRLGLFGDWFKPYVTMDYGYEANIVRSLGKIIENGHLEQGFKPVHWCIDCGSALAEAEVDYDDKTSPSIDVAFYCVDADALYQRFGVKALAKKCFIPIWTTTPWTLPANEAVCLHPSIKYVLVETDNGCMVVADALKDEVLQRYGLEGQVLATVEGKSLEMLALQHPFMDRTVPVVLGEHVTIETGTGCVHTAPAHGPDDFAIGKAYGLPLINPVKGNGCYVDDLPKLAGLHVNKANDAVKVLLEESQTLFHYTTITHSYPHCWRHKSPVIFRATPQWFISMDKNGLRASIKAAIKTVKWVPEWGEARITDMVENRPDWCISRQRAWGTPITLFIHKETGKLHPDTLNLIEKAACLIEQSGIDAWFELEPEILLGSDAPNYDKVTDTLDVWFDSGVSHHAVLASHKDLQVPASLYLEGSDQHRGWFNSSLTTSVAMTGKAPYEMVLTHGYTVDANGHKLSKSRGNYVALDKLIAEHGADIIRLWVSSTDYRNEVSISDEILKRTGDAYRRIRNTARFLLANLFDFDEDQHALPLSECVELDRWVMARTQELQLEIIEAYNQYQFHTIYQKIHNFCAIDLGSFYLDIIKDRQYTCPKNSHARRSCQTAMYHIVQTLVRWLAPIVSFTAEEIWQAIPGVASDSSVFLTQWYQGLSTVPDVDKLKWQQLLLIRDEVNKALEAKRQAGDIGSGLAAKVAVYAKGDAYDAMTSLKDELRFLFITSAAIVLPLSDKPTDAIMIESLGIAIAVNAISFEKCERCWHRCEEVGTLENHLTLCHRCEGNISGRDELRQFA